MNISNNVIRILDHQGQTVGAGFLVANDLAVTCAHVIEAAGIKPGGTVDIIFHTVNQKVQADVVRTLWRPISAEDVAFLHFDGGVPKGIEPVLLDTSLNVDQHPFVTLGFPESNSEGGVHGDGHILGMTNLGKVSVLQLSSTQVTPGFSGAPVFDTHKQRVVGMVTAIAALDQFGRLGDTAFVTPVETLIEVNPKLQNMKPVLPGIPYLNKNTFVGRQKEIMAIRSALLEGKIVILAGIVGVGKSHLVAEYVRAYSVEYPGGAHWLNWNDRNIDAGKLEVLSQSPQTLLVINDVDDAQWVFYAGAGKVYLDALALQCHLLITTRQYDRRSFRDQSAFPRYEFIRLKPLLARDAVTLLLKVSVGESIDDANEIEAAKQICHLLGNLPFAIEKAGKYLSHLPHVKLSEFLEKLKVREYSPIENEFKLLWESLPSGLSRHALKIASLLCVKDNWVSKSRLSLFTGMSLTLVVGRQYLEEALLPLEMFSLLEDAMQVEIRLSPLLTDFVNGQTLPESEAVNLVKALRDLINDPTQLETDRRQAALMLTQVKWLDYFPVASINISEILIYLELVGRSIKVEEFIYLIENCTKPLLKSADLSNRQIAQLLDFQAAFQAMAADEIQDDNAHQKTALVQDAANSYQKAGLLLDSLLKSDDLFPEDYKLSARIKLGYGNLLSRAGQAIKPRTALDKQQIKQFISDADELYADAIQDAKNYGLDPILTATIYGEQSYTRSLQANWEDAERLYQTGIEGLREYIRAYANILEIASNVYDERGESPTDFETAYQLVLEEIMILERLGGDSHELVDAHLNAADFAIKISRSDSHSLLDPIKKACDHRKAALPIAIRLGMNDDVKVIRKQLAKNCQ